VVQEWCRTAIRTNPLAPTWLVRNLINDGPCQPVGPLAFEGHGTDNPRVSHTDQPVSTEDNTSGQAQIRTFLIADMRGWTLFTQERGDETAAKLAAKFADISREIVEARAGTLLELRGDEALCVFASTREAIRAAIDLQQRFVEETLEQPELPLTVGIGLDAGEAVPVQGGYRGAALNLAARLCGQARAGEILATREVTHLARRIDGARYEDRGSLTFKGISDPVVVVRVVPKDTDPIERLRPFAPPHPTAKRTSRRWVIPVGVVAALALVAVSIPLLGSNDSSVVVGTNSIALMNAEDGSLELAEELGERPGASAIGFESLWVLQPDRGTVARLDLQDGSIIDTGIRVGASPAGIAVGMGSVWVTNAGDGTVSRIDPVSNEVSDTLPGIGARPSGIAVGDGALWVGDALSAELLRVDPLSRDTTPVPLDGQPSGVAFTPEGVWVSHAPDGVARVDPEDLSITANPNVGNGPTAVLPALGSVWVANHLDNTVSRLEPSTGKELAKIPVGEGPNALVAAAGSVWIANEFDDSITSIDPSTNSGTPVPVGGAATSLAADGGEDLWLGVGVSATEHRGGTLTVSTAETMEGASLTSLDPAIVFYNDLIGGQILSITNDGLLSYKKVGGTEGTTLVPDLASALPQVFSNGLTYRFPLREGIRYSNGAPVQPEDFRRAVERTIALNPGAEFRYYYDAIDGAEACRQEPSTCDLSETIVADTDAVTFHLARRDPDLPFKLAMPWAYPVPAATPMRDQGLDPLPATGPYMIAEAGAGRIELVRNLEFREWSGAAQPDGFVDAIAWRFGVDPATSFDRLNAGELDWMTSPPSDEDLRSLQTADPDRVVVLAEPATIFFGFDVRRPPFDDVLVRQALNFAIDRNRALELRDDSSSYRVMCQILPPNLQGYEPFCPYTLEPDSGAWSAPNLDRARELIDAADAKDERVTVWTTDAPGSDILGEVELMTYIVKLLDELGLRAHLKTVHEPDEYLDVINSGEAHAYLLGWASAYPSAHDFIALQFRCGADFNVSGLCSHTLDKAIDDAKRLQATDPAAANSAWIEIEHRLVEDAIWVPLQTLVSTHAFSNRTENIQAHPIWGVLQSRLWVQ
jgi:YVTN family beta-propeller protein